MRASVVAITVVCSLALAACAATPDPAGGVPGSAGSDQPVESDD